MPRVNRPLLSVLLLMSGIASPVVAAPPPASGSATTSQQAQQPLTRAQFLVNLRARFDAVDTNHDGYLEENEVAAAQQKNLQQLQVTEQQRLEAEFNRLDTNHDGTLSKQEFMAAAPRVRARDTPLQIIQQLDRHKHGKVSFEDYAAGPLANFDKLARNGVVTPQDIEAARQAAAQKASVHQTPTVSKK